MSKLKSKVVRARKKQNRDRKKAEEVKAFQKQFDMHPDVAKRISPGKRLQLSMRREREIKKRVEDAENYIKILANAKLLSIVSDDFDYMIAGVAKQSDVERYKEELVAVMGQFEGKTDVPETVLDGVIRAHMVESLKNGLLLPMKPKVGTLPKLRKLKNGTIMVMEKGDMDYDYLLEQFGKS